VVRGGVVWSSVLILENLKQERNMKAIVALPTVGIGNPLCALYTV
jgi:hypothetical protein